MEVNANDANFEKEVVEKSKEIPVLVDFYAIWCGPCKMLGSVLEQIAKDYDGKFVLAKLNVDENPQTSAKFGISPIPDVRLIKNGEVVNGFTGARPGEVIKKWLDENL